MTGRRVFLPAAVGPWAAYVIARDHGEVLERKAREMASAQPEVSRQLLSAVAQLREAGRQVFDAAAERRGGSDSQAGGGSAEVPGSGSGAGSVSPPWVGLRTSEAATRLAVSDRQVRNLIGAGVLVAARQGRGWAVDEVSVAVELERRRSADDDRKPGAA